MCVCSFRVVFTCFFNFFNAVFGLPDPSRTDTDRFSMMRFDSPQFSSTFNDWKNCKNPMGQTHGPGPWVRAPMGLGPWAHGPIGIRLQFWVPTFRVNVAEPPRLLTKYNLSELIPGFHGFCENGPNWAGPTLGSTRAGGKDDDSLHKLPQIIFFYDFSVFQKCYKTVPKLQNYQNWHWRRLHQRPGALWATGSVNLYCFCNFAIVFDYFCMLLLPFWLFSGKAWACLRPGGYSPDLNAWLVVQHHHKIL